MTGYSAFARFYDQVMGDRGSEAAYVRALIAKHYPGARTVLELACGTGAILAQLRQDFTVSGLDLSREMLEVAAQKIPDGRLYHEDMTRFELGERFDVVLCVFDSLNHLGSFEQWEAVFDRAREHLAAGGIFVFDVNTERKLARVAGAPPWIQWFDDESLFLIDVREGEDGAYDWNVRVFEHTEASTYRLHAEDIRERAFPIGRIEAALDERFARVSISDAERARPTARSERLYFVCR